MNKSHYRRKWDNSQWTVFMILCLLVIVALACHALGITVVNVGETLTRMGGIVAEQWR